MRTAAAGTGPRAARARALRRVAGAVLAVAAAAIAATGLFAGVILVRLDRRAERAVGRLGSSLRDNHGVVFYAPLDERTPADLVSGLPLHGSSAVRVPGAIGFARRFDGRPGENLVGGPGWFSLASGGFTLALRARLPIPPADASSGPRTGENRLVWDVRGSSSVGFRIRDEALEAVFTDAEGAHALSGPAPAPGRWTHLALSVGQERAALFVDGVRVADAPVVGSLSLPASLASIGTDGHAPTVFDVDEWCVWKRPLPDAEIARLAAPGRSVADRLEPRLAARARRRAAQAAAFRSICRVLGAVRTPPVPAVLNRSVPVLELHLARADRRHFRNALLEAASSGFRTRRGAKRRGVLASFGGRTERVAVWLDEVIPEAPPTSRPAFVLASKGGLFGPGSGLARLFPPEQFGARRPDAARPLPLDASTLVRLHLDDDFLGLYCLVPFEAPAPPWFATGARDILRPDRLHFFAPATDSSAGAGLAGPERDVAWNRVLALLRTDSAFPLGRAEASALAKSHARNRERLAIPDPVPGPEQILGANPAALYVTNDLDLAAAGPGLAWRSSDPATISPEGRVARPEDGRPRLVVLSADLPGGAVRECRLRVIPRAPALPALFLWFGRPLDKLSRADFACLRIPAGKDPEPSWLFGTGPGGGGARLRGNTSFVAGRRRPMNLEFDEPVEFPGAAEPVRHLLLLSGYADPTRLRNALSYDVFRAMSPVGTVRSAPVAWTEVFVNGSYAGVWECCPRLQDVISEPFSALYKVRSSKGLWSDPDAASEGVDRVGAEEDDDNDPYAPIREITRFVSGTDPGDFAAGADAAFDLSELLDFYLLLNFTGNEDGRVTNQYLGLRAEDGRWLLLPWDYDKTFLPGRVAAFAASGRTSALSNPLFARLFHDAPELRARLSARWRAFRSGPLSDAALDAWIDERAALLAPSMDEDYRVVPPLGHNGDFASAIRLFRDEVHARAAWLDDRLGIR